MVMQPGISDYAELAGKEAIEELRRLAGPLEGLSFLHVNSTREGGGVAELLRRLVPLLGELGLEARWEVIEGTPLFFRTTKGLHNALQGAEVELSPEMLEEYRRVNRENAERLDLEADAVVIHDPQPAALIDYRPSGRSRSRWLWRCHIDLSRPNQEAWDFLRSYVERYDLAIFSSPEFIRWPSAPLLIAIIPPSIDPLGEKNRELTREEVERVYSELGIPRDKPVLLQVSRFDRFKDPLGVIRLWRLVREEHGRDCRLVLAGGMATDDPEGEEVLRRVREEAAGEPDIHILPRPPAQQLTDLEVNALQRGADVVLQKSLREGFALTVTEALWKGKPVVATPTGGIKLQVIDGVTGCLASSTEEAASKVAWLLEHPDRARKLGEAGREHVRRNFLITRHLRDYLKLLSAIFS